MPRFLVAFTILCNCPAWLATATSLRCKNGQYQSSALVLDCNGGVGSMDLGLKKAEALSIGSFPVGTQNVSITLSSNVDFDMQLIDTNIGMCVVGFNCDHQQKCSGPDDFCISYKQMPVHFSGDDDSPPVDEAMKIKGALTTPMDFAVFAQAVGTGTVKYKYSALNPCTDPAPGCSPCSDYTGCLHGGTPVCDGTSTVLCVPSTTKATTSTTKLPPTTTIATTTVASTTQPPTTQPPPSTTMVATMPVTVAPTTTIAPLPTTPPGPNPCSVVQPGVTPGPNPCAPIVGSEQLAQPVVDAHPRPRDVLSAAVKNISHTATKVGGMIKHRVVSGFENVQDKVNNGLDTIKEKVVLNLNKADNTLNKIPAAFALPPADQAQLDALRPPKPTWPPSWNKNLPAAWKGTNIMGKEQTMSDAPGEKSERRVPLALGPWFASLFTSWTAPGSLCAIWFFSMASVLFYFTGFRVCTIVRKKVRGYAQVSPPAARVCQSRDVFSLSAREEGLPSAPAEADCEGASRGHLLRSELE